MATDAAGKSSVSEEYLFIVDTVPPASPVLKALGDYVTTPQPAFEGTAEPHSTVKVWLVDNAVARGTAEADAAGVWSLHLLAALPDGAYQVRATATDKAGNPSAASEVLAFTVDTVPPGLPC